MCIAHVFASMQRRSMKQTYTIMQSRFRKFGNATMFILLTRIYMYLHKCVYVYI